jgi:proteasome lid subunit RPN8/RPN11
MTSPAVHLSDDLRRRIVEHCLAELPNEGCGLLAVDNDRIVDVYPTDNADASPVRYTIPPHQHLEALNDAESRGWEIGGAFHSHPNGPARMSATDLEKALEREWVYVVVGLVGIPILSGWRNGQTVAL